MYILCFETSISVLDKFEKTTGLLLFIMLIFFNNSKIGPLNSQQKNSDIGEHIQYKINANII